MKKKREIIKYEDKACIICEYVYVKSIIISLPQKDVVLCECCAKDLKESLR